MVDAYTRTWAARYEMLDGLRGLACLGVPLHHLSVAPVLVHLRTTGATRTLKRFESHSSATENGLK
jgi:hypothetical protein